jgi:ribosomal protein S12 methylthiotransferase
MSQSFAPAQSPAPVAPVPQAAQPQQSVHFISLGCPKNRVDSEVMLGHLAAAGYTHTHEAAAAQVIVVNTCGFIDAAKEESVDAITEMAELKRTGACQTLVVTGCLSQRYAPALAEALPEVDHFLGTGNFEAIAQVLRGDAAANDSGAATANDSGAATQASLRPVHPRLRGRNALVPFRHPSDPQSPGKVSIPDPDFTLTSASPRLRTLASYSTYLKISEGCSNTCAFCVIPKLRGPQRSRSIEDILQEARRLIAEGAVEINLIAQDLCAYGKDLKPRQDLAELLTALNDLTPCRPGAPLWFRCLYAYPKGLSNGVIEVLGAGGHVLPYLDIPLQHIADAMLRRMRRGAGGEHTRRLMHTLRERVPNLALRTTFITGMPGETEAEFAELCSFVEEMQFEQLGVFAYSKEEDTVADVMRAQVDPAVAQARRDQLMALQKGISQAVQRRLLGTEVEVLVEGPSAETPLLLQGRHRGQAPDIDGLTYITEGTATAGEVVRVRVDQAGDYDVAGGICSE